MTDPLQTNLHGPTFVEWRSEIQEQTDRGAAIIAAAFLDARLEEVILSQLPQSGQPTDRLFSGNAPIGSFSAKIDMVFAMGLIGLNTHRDLTLMRKIRNEFAHHFGAISFGTPSIRSQCSEIWICQTYKEYKKVSGPTDPREQYLQAVLMIFHLLVTELDERRNGRSTPKNLL